MNTNSVSEVEAERERDKWQQILRQAAYPHYYFICRLTGGAPTAAMAATIKTITTKSMSRFNLLFRCLRRPAGRRGRPEQIVQTDTGENNPLPCLGNHINSIHTGTYLEWEKLHVCTILHNGILLDGGPINAIVKYKASSGGYQKANASRARLLAAAELH